MKSIEHLKIWEATIKELIKKDLYISEEVERKLREMINDGVSTILKGKDIKSDLQVGIIRIGSFVDSLTSNQVRRIANSNIITSTDQKLITEDDFDKTRSFLCPGFWPFC